MASTSLAEQLKRLAAPQSSVYSEKKTIASLLFSPTEAAHKDRDTFYEIGISGLNELIALCPDFQPFKDTLFSISSKDFERAIQSKETNDNLNENIEKFLLLLSPYLLLQSSHKAIEWLLNRYSIHEYNIDAIMQLILPYHETKIFVRCYQLLKIHSEKNMWYCLKSIKEHGVALTKQLLYNQCCGSNYAILKFISKMTLKYVKVFGQRVSELNTIFAFYCSVCIGVMNTKKEMDKQLLTVMLPVLLKALDAPAGDFRSAGYIVLGFYMSKNGRNDRIFLNELLFKLFSSDEMTYETVLLVNLIYSTQENVEDIPEEILNNISPDVMKLICIHINTLISQNIKVTAFVTLFLKSVLKIIQNDTEEFLRFSKLPEMLAEELDLREEEPEKIIKLVITTYNINYDSIKSIEGSDGEGSDVEIVEEKNDSPTGLLNWYSKLLQILNRKYPDHFDKAYKQAFDLKLSGDNRKKDNLKRKLYSKLFSFKTELSHIVGDYTLVEASYDYRANVRAEAYKYVLKNYQTIKAEDPEFLKDSIMRALTDDSSVVVTVALETPVSYLSAMLTSDELVAAFLKIVARNSKHDFTRWQVVSRLAVEVFCNCDKFPVTQETVLPIMTYLFPYSAVTSEVANKLVGTLWGKKFVLTKAIQPLIASKDPKDHEVFCDIVFSKLISDSNLAFTFLDANTLNKKRLTDICFFLLLKSHNFGTASVEDMATSLNVMLEAIESRSILRSDNSESFDLEVVNEMINLAMQDKMLFEFIEYIFEKMIQNISVKSIKKPWCDYCEGPAVFVRQLYEICVTGCFIATYSESYSKLLKKLLERICINDQEKFEFMCNFACGNILVASDPKHVISPELQLRSLVLIKNGVEATSVKRWMFNSHVMITTILFGLNNPLPVIRATTLAIVKAILVTKIDTSTLYQNILQELIKYEEEMAMDHDQLPQILNNILRSPNLIKISKDPSSQLLENLFNAPGPVAAEMLNVVSEVNSSKIFSKIVPHLKPITVKMQFDKSPKFVLNIYESKVVRNVFGRFNEKTAANLGEPEVWANIEYLLREYRECVLEADLSQVSPAVVLLKKLTYPVFKQIPDERAVDVIRMICRAGALSGNANISSAAAKTMKKFHLNYEHFAPILQAMLSVPDPAAQSNPKKTKSSVAMLSYQLSETPEWKTGVAVLEYVQNKDKMTVDNKFVLMLFQILNRCLRFEEQSYVEYTKQLILSSLWFYCDHFVDNCDKEQIVALTAVFDIELVVQCIRNTQNPQTHHHALILLSYVAAMLPEQVLHHTMEIFTFMGTSVLRHDDAYSFQIIVKIIETLVPILIKANKSVERYKGRELEQLQGRVVPVLRIFADAVLHVPEHRRLPLYKKLVDTVGANHFMWVFLALLLETHMKNFERTKERPKHDNRNLADQEAPVNRIDFGQSILLEFPPEACFENFSRLMTHIKSLPMQKVDTDKVTPMKAGEIFSVDGHTALQLRHYKYVTITFMNSCLSSQRFIQHVSQASNTEAMEKQYKSFIISVLTYIQTISKNTSDEKSAKYWRVMLHHCYDLLDNANNLLSVNMFLSVVRGLVKHNLPTVRRKAIELLNSKIQFSPEFFVDCDKDLFFSILPALLDIVKTIETKEPNQDEDVTGSQEMELIQQTALLCLKLLTRMLAAENPDAFKPVLETITTYTCNQSISGNVMASVVLCLAELCGNLKAHALVSLWKFMPALIKVLKQQRQAETPELILLSTVTAVAKIVESLPLFLSPYLQKILTEYSILLAKWQAFDQDCTKVSSIVSKLMNIKKKIANCIPPRVLIPIVNQTHQSLLEKENYDAIGPVMSVLADSFANVTAADFNTLQQDLVSFFITALELRSDAAEKGVDKAIVDTAEDEVINALVCLVLKLSESNFRPLYFKVYDWAIRSNVEGKKDRAITFYRLSSAIAEKLKGLFVLFAGHFIKNSSELLDACNNSKTEDLYFESEDKCIDLVNSILNTLKIVFLYDSQNFMNKERFETLMQPIVDQLENTLGGIEGLKARAKELVIPCISQFAVATADDSLWKLLNYQILLKTRHNDAEIRLTALDCLVAMATQLAGQWLPLLAESVPFLAELLEDSDSAVEGATKDAVRKLEVILGEPLEKYF